MAYSSEHCARGISGNQVQFPTRSIVPRRRNTLGEIACQSRDRIDADKTGTEQLGTTFLSDVGLITAPGVKREPDVVLKGPRMTCCVMEST